MRSSILHAQAVYSLSMISVVVSSIWECEFSFIESCKKTPPSGTFNPIAEKPTGPTGFLAGSLFQREPHATNGLPLILNKSY